MERSAIAAAHEDGLAIFIESAWRPRFRESLTEPRLRKKLQAKLYHFRHLDTRYTTAIPSANQTSAYLSRALRARGAPQSCYLLSDDDELDGRVLGLKEALELVVDDGRWTPTFISCIPGKLAYFHEEEIENRHILQR
jgi:hypothetical protein